MEENKDTPADQPQENIPGEIFSSEQSTASETEQPSTIPKMETHAHELHKVPGQGWKHYFFEFLMLFLAVSLGFFVENQREHYVEHQREKKFARQLLADLRADSLTYTLVVKGINKGLENHKKFTALMTANAAPTNRDIANAFISLGTIYTISKNTATYSQMKSSGSLRYIQKDELTIELQRYYEASLKYIETLEKLETDFYTTHIQPYSINHFMITDFDFANDSLINQTPVFLNRTPETETQFINIMGTYEYYVQLHLKNAILPSQKKANTIISMLKKEYRLK